MEDKQTTFFSGLVCKILGLKGKVFVSKLLNFAILSLKGVLHPRPVF